MSDFELTPASLIDMEDRAPSSSSNEAISGSLKQEHHAASDLHSAPAGASTCNTSTLPLAQSTASSSTGAAASSSKVTSKTRSSSSKVAAQRTGLAAQSRSSAASKPPTNKAIERKNRYRESAARMAQRTQKLSKRYEAAWASRRATTLQAEWDLEHAEQEAVEGTSDKAKEGEEVFEASEQMEA